MQPIEKARLVQAALPKCAATSRQTGEPCKNPGLGAGGRCRFHGGASTGRPPTHGYATKQAKLDRDRARLLLGLNHAINGGKSNGFIKPGHLKRQRCEALLRVIAPIKHPLLTAIQAFLK